MAVDVLISKGVPEDHILFLNLIASPEGARNFAQKYPKVRVVTAFVDQGLDKKKYVYFTFPSLRTALIDIVTLFQV
jgi:uracil phosphoribosyltransferase